MNDKKILFADKEIKLSGVCVKKGDKALDFTVVDSNLSPVSLHDFYNKTIVISVFPSIDTPVCALQNKKFNKEASSFSDDIVVLSLSVDLPFAQKRFCVSEGINRIQVLSDYIHLDFGMKYGFVIEPLRLLARGIVVIDRSKVIRYVEYVYRQSDEPDYVKALGCIKAVSGSSTSLPYCF